MRPLQRYINSLDVGTARSKLMKALTVEPSTGAAITDIAISDALTNTVIALSPEIALLELEGSKSYTYYYDVVSSLGAPTGAIGGGATTPSRQSSYSRNSVTMKSIRNRGAVADFLKDTSQELNRIDAVAVEMENQLLAQTWDVNYNVIYGNNTANAYEMNGWETNIPAANRISYFTSGAPTVPTDLSIVNDMIAYSDRKGGNRHRKALICSPEMNQRLGFLLTSTRIQYGIPGTLETVEINGGYRLTAYQGIPILPSTFLGGQGAGTMGSISLASGGTTGGSLSDGTYYASVTYISKYGESMGSAIGTVTLSGGTATQKITISFTDVPDAYSYIVYAGTVNAYGSLTRKKKVTAWTYDSTGTPTGRISSISLTSLTADSSVSTSSAVTTPNPVTATKTWNSEMIMLIDLDPVQGMGKMVYANDGNRMNGLVTIEPLAKTDANLPFLITTNATIVPAFPDTSLIAYGLRAG